MAHNRAERRRKMALIKRRLERKVRQDVIDHARWAFEPVGRHYVQPAPTELDIRRWRLSNEGKHGRSCMFCGHHACERCLAGFYRKHLQRSQALEQDIRDYLSGGYDALREEGLDIPAAKVIGLPHAGMKCPL